MRGKNLYLFFAAVIAFVLVLSWCFIFPQQAGKGDIQDARETFSAALRGYYTGDGSFKSDLKLYHKLRKGL
jgi:hypothetical protein